jgi:hypothetical protein
LFKGIFYQSSQIFNAQFAHGISAVGVYSGRGNKEKVCNFNGGILTGNQSNYFLFSVRKL